MSTAPLHAADAPPRRRRPRGRLVALVLLLLALVVAGCSTAVDDSSLGGDTEDTGAAVGFTDDAGGELAEEGAVAQDLAQEQAEQAAADGGGDAGVPVEQTRAQVEAGQDRMIARDATIDLVVDDVQEVASQVRAAAVAVDGYVVSEEVVPTREELDDPGFGTFVLSVPSESLDAVVDQLSSYGTVTSSGLTSHDVTEQYVDTTARIETLQASVARVRDLLEQASSIEDIVKLEAELSQREAELDAMLAVQQSIEADVSRSSVTVHLSTDESLLAAQKEEEPSGFVAGLQQGWEAFGAATAMLLTGLGAILPFLIAAAVVGVPVLVLSRRRRGVGSTAPAAPPA
jgi:hypothetical protein